LNFELKVITFSPSRSTGPGADNGEEDKLNDLIKKAKPLMYVCCEGKNSTTA